MPSVQEQPFQVKSNERRNFTIIPNRLLQSGYPMGATVTLAIIASHSWEGSSCTASLRTLQKESGLSRPTLIKYIQFWTEKGIFKVNKKEGIGTEIIVSFDFTEGGKIDLPLKDEVVKTRREVVKTRRTGGKLVLPKEDTIKKTKKEDSISDDKKTNEVNAVFGAFASLNPMLNYGNRTQRAAATALIGKYGLEKTVKLVEAAVQVQGRDYAPVITSPLELKDKLAKLKMYFERNNPSAQFVKVS